MHADTHAGRRNLYVLFKIMSCCSSSLLVLIKEGFPEEGASEQGFEGVHSPSTYWTEKWKHREVMKLVQGHTEGREKQGLNRTQDLGPKPTISSKCQVDPRAASKRKPGERLPARVWNPFARPSVFSQGEVGGPGLSTPQHHLFPVYLFILKSHPPTLLGAPNIPVSPQRGAKGTGTVKSCWIRQDGLMSQLRCPCHVSAVPYFMLEASLWA